MSATEVFNQSINHTHRGWHSHKQWHMHTNTHPPTNTVTHAHKHPPTHKHKHSDTCTQTPTHPPTNTNTPQLVKDSDQEREGVAGQFFLAFACTVEFVESVQQLVDQVSWWDERPVRRQERLLVDELYSHTNNTHKTLVPYPMNKMYWGIGLLVEVYY
jgi:hypothetical protein